ncbi:hypothetical protein [Kitasatospora cineracea]|uniref:hypothetical protein n=1 Tax=Kitasatospora cineracea TaxID=88074 RepID=UPI0037930CC4
MTKRSTDRMTVLRGTQEVLAHRGMAADPAGVSPPPPPGTAPAPPPPGTAPATRTGPHYGDAVFSHGGRRMPAAAGPADGPATHTDLPGHRHRGAERHSAH